MRPYDIVRELEQKVQDQKQHIARLQQENSRLRDRHELVAAIAEATGWMRAQVHGIDGGDGAAADAAELELLAQLEHYAVSHSSGASDNNNNVSSVSSRTSSRSSRGAAHEPRDLLSPPGDPLFGFRMSFSQPHDPAACSMSSEDLHSFYASVVREVSVWLAQHQAKQLHPDDPAEPEPLDRLMVTFWKYFQLLASFVRADRFMEVVKLPLGNYGGDAHKGTVMALQQPDLQRHIRVAAALQLSRQQQRSIVDGFEVFCQLMEPIREEQRRRHPLVKCPLPGPAAAAAVAAVAAYKAAMAECEAQTKRLKVLNKMEALLKSQSLAFVFGCLTWEQVAQLHVLMFPQRPHQAVFVEAVKVLLRAAEKEAAGRTRLRSG